MNYSRKDLEDLYSGVAGKPVQPRKHLNVWMERDIEEDVAQGKPEGAVTKSDIIKLLDQLEADNVLNTDDLGYVKNFLSIRPYKGKIVQHLNNHNLNERTIVEGNVEDIILDVLSLNGDVENYAHYLDKQVNLANIPKFGFMINEVVKVSGLSPDTVRHMIHIKGTESGRGVGKGEISTSALFGDIMQGGAGEGDLNWNGKYLEVKGTDARLGGWDRKFSNFENTSLGKLASSIGINTVSIQDIIVNVASNIKDLDAVQRAVDEFTAMAWNNDFLPSKSVDLKNLKDVRHMLTTIYFTSYALAHSVSDFLFINTGRTSSFSRYRIFNAKEISDLVKSNSINCGVIKLNDLDPSLSTI